MYSIDNKKSFKKATDLIDELKSVNLREASVALVGNKADLLSKRQVSKNEAEQHASRVGSLFFEVSAMKDAHEIQSVFVSLYNEIAKIRCDEEKRALTPKFVRKMFRGLSGGGLRERSGTV